MTETLKRIYCVIVMCVVVSILTHSEAYAASIDCGSKALSIKMYQDISLYSIVVGFILFFAGVLIDKKQLKSILLGLTFPCVAIWAYVNFAVDYEQIQKDLFVYKVQAESALANIAEGQERYKNEHGVYLTDLNKLYSHLAGAHGVDACVRILELKATNDNWSAVAQHVSSPEKVFWDGKSGSTLKKG